MMKVIEFLAAWTTFFSLLFAAGFWSANLMALAISSMVVWAGVHEEQKNG